MENDFNKTLVEILGFFFILFKSISLKKPMQNYYRLFSAYLIIVYFFFMYIILHI